MSDADREVYIIPQEYKTFLNEIAPRGLEEFILVHEPIVGKKKTLKFRLIAFPGEYVMSSNWTKDKTLSKRSGWEVYHLKGQIKLENISSYEIELFIPHSDKVSEIRQNIESGKLNYKHINVGNSKYKDINV